MEADSAGTATRTGENFHALSCFAVLIVIYGNGYILTGAVAPGLWGEPFFRIGVHLLFAIGGLRLAARWQQDPSWRRAAAYGAARLLPGLAAAVLATMLVIGPLATKLSLRFYLLNGQTLGYLGNIVLTQQRTLPRVFEGQQYSGSVNPMLWTLTAGLLLAACVPLVAAWPPRIRPAALSVAAGGLGGLAIALAPLPGSHWFVWLHVDIRLVLAEAPFFLMGVLWCHLDRPGGEVFRADIAVLAFAANWFVATWWSDWALPLLWLTLPYMAACFGRERAAVLVQVPNLAYGMFLVAFPVQQAIVALFPDIAHPIVACTLLAAGWGALSWFAVERPALLAAGTWRGWPDIRPRRLSRQP